MKHLFTFIFIGISSLLFSQDLYDNYRVQDIKVTIKNEHWERTLDSLKNLGTKERILGDVSINGKMYKDVGIRYKGNSSYYNVKRNKSRKLPFNFQANYKNKKQKFDGKYSRIKLSNVFRDPSFVREVLAYEIARKYMAAPRANFARVYVNDEYIGLYTNVESVDNEFLDKNFGHHKGVFVKCDPDNYKSTKEKPKKGCLKGEYASMQYIGKDSICYENYYELKSKKGWKEFIYLVAVLNSDKKDISKYLDVDQALWMHAFNNVLVNLDSYTGWLSHNYYVYRDTSGIFHPILWDMNLAFGGFTFDGEHKQKLSLKEMQEMSMFLHYTNKKRPLISKLLKNALYRKIYIAHVKTILDENFTNGWYLKRAKEIQQFIDYYVKNDENKLYSYEDFKKNLNSTTPIGKIKICGISELMEQRKQKLSNHPILKKIAPKIVNTYHNKSTDKILFTTKVEGAQKVFIAIREGQDGTFKKYLMNDKGKDGDKISEDGTYSFEFDIQSGLNYYIIAEGEKVASLSPEKASFEFYTVK